ncbi:hypothetical protein BBJ28_00024763, partial [Nothophytophthora sp. Chile5]
MADVIASPVPTAAPAEWPESMTTTETIIIAALPVLALLLSYVMLRIVWPVHTALPIHSAVPSYGATGEPLQPIAKIKTSLVEEGEVAGDYEEHW